MKFLSALRACSVGFAILAVNSSALAQIAVGGLTQDPWHGEGDYFARFAGLDAWPFVERVTMFQLLLPDDRRRSRVEEPRRSEDPKRSVDEKRSEAPMRSEVEKRPEGSTLSDDPKRSEGPTRSEAPKRSDVMERPGMFAPHLTPEPSTWLLLGTGLVGIVGLVLIRSARP